MTIIGTFSKTADGYAGTIRTMTINVQASLVAHNKNGKDKAPDFKLLVGEKEFGAAWRAVAKGESGKAFLRVEVDDPSFPTPIAPRSSRMAKRERPRLSGAGGVDQVWWDSKWVFVVSMTAVKDSETRRIDRLRGRDSAQPLDPYGRLLKLADVMQSIGVSQAMVYKLMHDERLPFPRPIKIGRVSVWIERDVVRWKAIVAGDFSPDTFIDDM